MRFHQGCRLKTVTSTLRLCNRKHIYILVSVISQEGKYKLLKNPTVNIAVIHTKYPTSHPDLCYGASHSYYRYLPQINEHRRTAERFDRCQQSSSLQEWRTSRSGKLPPCIPFKCHV
ncbi:hypothetical protein DPMN_102370 [Dreissena polymorpha]|uniref:Uncharacterized protein n=1 Tax=Dreissena polymorpha TaxID=45954 RepID=A0A9D4LJ71_DREPO|nr:hypothetical protein DPMN_102370 [Dreissena polymorpha]